MALLKRMGLYGESIDGLSIDRATSLEDLLKAYGLVHDVFVEAGYILPRPCGLRVRCYEAVPETATFVAKVKSSSSAAKGVRGPEGQVVGVQSLVVDSEDLGLPSDEAFREEIDSLRRDCRLEAPNASPGVRKPLVGEATNEAVDQAYRRSAVPTELMRCCFAHALAVGCTDLITTVSPGHAKFYALLGFEQISPVRSYSSEIHDPVVVVRLKLDVLDERFADVVSGDGSDEGFLKSYYIEDNPYHRQVRLWSAIAGRTFADPAILRELFVNSSDLLERCSAMELSAIRRRWGEEAFRQVWGAELAALSR